MAGLIIASRVYPTCGFAKMRTSGSPDAIHAFLDANPRLLQKDMAARHKVGHDDCDALTQFPLIS
jgi:hypothetical protein